MSAGAPTFAITYIATAYGGAIAWDSVRRKMRKDGQSWDALAPEDRRELQYGAWLTVPLLGPFVAIGFSQSATRSVSLGLSGVLQVSGLVMTCLGARRLARLDRNRRVGFGATASATGTAGSVTLRF